MFILILIAVSAFPSYSYLPDIAPVLKIPHEPETQHTLTFGLSMEARYEGIKIGPRRTRLFCLGKCPTQ